MPWPRLRATPWYLGSVRIGKYPVEVEIPRGAGFRTAMEQLDKSGIVIRRYEFELLARALGKERDIKAGSYEISQPVTPLELLQSSPAATSPRRKSGCSRAGLSPSFAPRSTRARTCATTPRR